MKRGTVMCWIQPPMELEPGTSWFKVGSIYYKNMPIQIYKKFYNQKQKIFRKKSDIFHISALNIDCGYLLELPHWGSSNKYPQSMFLAK